MIAVKDNKQIKIEDSEKATYLTLGYDIADISEDGKSLNIIENAPNKLIPYVKYKEALDKIATLEAEIETINKTAKK
jgi:hypothetical protein